MKIPVMDYYSVQLQPIVLVGCLKHTLHLHKFDTDSEHTVVSIFRFLERFFWFCFDLIASVSSSN